MFHAQLPSWLARLAFGLVVAAFVAGAGSQASAQSDQIEGAKINWHKYMQHAHSAAAIAMALSNVQHCSKELGITESEFTDPETKKNYVILSFGCYGNEDEEGNAFLFFSGTRKILEDHQRYGPPMLSKFEFAG